MLESARENDFVFIKKYITTEIARVGFYTRFSAQHQRNINIKRQLRNNSNQITGASQYLQQPQFDSLRYSVAFNHPN